MILNKLNQNKKNQQKTEKISIAKEKPPKKQMNVEVQIFPHKQFGYFL